MYNAHAARFASWTAHNLFCYLAPTLDYVLENLDRDTATAALVEATHEARGTAAGNIDGDTFTAAFPAWTRAELLTFAGSITDTILTEAPADEGQKVLRAAIRAAHAPADSRDAVTPRFGITVTGLLTHEDAGTEHSPSRYAIEITLNGAVFDNGDEVTGPIYTGPAATAETARILRDLADGLESTERFIIGTLEDSNGQATGSATLTTNQALAIITVHR